ncbi:Phytocyanin domain-containing protein [Heracleum sosnowskyi]|uniref:Phytocyanin domain-containing protein n=1 Tax=Heracleum sosnowskyi TaxID=360622 RepID=A0AAD8H325_9APIA|nr:Phytocyanin domain-containing protein [Heracleum sosnowskyi]
MASMLVQLVMLLLVAGTLLVVSDANRNFAKGPENWNSGFNFSSGWPWNRPNIPQNYSSPPGFNFTAGWPWNSPNIPQNYSSHPGFNFTGGWPWKRPNVPQPRRVVVGDDEKWHFGFNYTDWAIKNGPFYLNDTLVFKYDPPSNTTFPHSVYQLRNYRSFQNCDLRRAKRLASVTQGGGNGFELVLKNWKPYYFACGEREGFHCKVGLMKFSVMPLIRWGY